MRYWFGLVLLFVCTHLCFPQGGHVVSGSVHEEATNSPISSVALEILSSGTRAAPAVMSGINGEFQFSGLRDGDFYIVASKEGYDTATVRVSVLIGGGAPPVTIALHKRRPDRPDSAGDSVSAHELSIPDKAREEYEKGRKLLYEKSAPAKAISQFREAIDKYPQYYEAFTQIGVANYRLSNFSEAEKALRKAIELSEGKYLDALFLLAQMLDDEGKFADAEPLARQGLALEDSCWRCHFELARALVGLKRGPEAEGSAVRAQKLKPDDPQVYLVLANAHLQERNYSAVVQDFDAYLKLDPNGSTSADIRQRRDRLRNALENGNAQTAKP